MAITRRSFRRARSKRARSKRTRTSKSYKKGRNKTLKRMKGGNNEDDMFPLVSYNEQKDAGDELLDYVYKYVVHCYLTPNQNPEVNDIRNGILNVLLGNKPTAYNINSADLIKKNSCPSWFSYSARKNCEIKKSWAYFLMCLILLDEIHKGIILGDDYNQKIIILDNKMSRSIVGIAPKVTDPNYNLAKLLESKSNNILNSIANTTTRKIIAGILKMITIRQEQISREDEKRETTKFKKLTPSKIQNKFPILKKTIQEENDDDDDDDENDTASETASDSST